jgi:Icc-related predicted phosphoesterase
MLTRLATLRVAEGIAASRQGKGASDADPINTPGKFKFEKIYAYIHSMYSICVQNAARVVVLVYEALSY